MLLLGNHATLQVRSPEENAMNGLKTASDTAGPSKLEKEKMPPYCATAGEPVKTFVTICREITREFYEFSRNLKQFVRD